MYVMACNICRKNVCIELISIDKVTNNNLLQVTINNVQFALFGTKQTAPFVLHHISEKITGELTEKFHPLKVSYQK